MAGDAGTDQLNPPPEPEPAPSRLSRRWLAGIAAGLVVLAGASAAGGIAALRSHSASQARARYEVAAVAALLMLAGGVGAGGALALHEHQGITSRARYEAAAVSAAKDCVGATPAPDTSSITAAQQKIIDCGTDTYRTQALLYGNGLIQAYQAANVHVQVSDLRTAVLGYNDSDGSVDVLVALRVNVSSDQVQNRETGYRLRVKMTPVDGQYKISELHQVTR